MNGTDTIQPVTRMSSVGDLGHITITGLRKTFGDKTIFDGFDVAIPKGKITSIFGPNGCGKSTLLNLVAGLIPADHGQIDLGRNDHMPGREDEKPRTAYVFQDYRAALFPWRTALENIAYPLKVAGYTKRQRKERIDELVEMLGITFDLTAYPYTFSGGQMQLTAVARSLALQPDILFLDEPFSALDYEMTLSLRDKLQEVYEATGVTMVVVSHDLEEAVYLSDVILLLTRPPTAVAKVLDYPAPRPRTVRDVAGDEFNRVKAEALQIFQAEVRQ